MNTILQFLSDLGIIVFSPFPGLPSIVLATIFLFIYRSRLKSKFTFWVFSFFVCYGAKLIISHLGVKAYSMGGEYSWFSMIIIYGGFIIWIAVSILGVKLLARKYTIPNIIIQNGQSSSSSAD